MKKFRKYLSILLLIAFSWVITPAHTIHDLFADHEDTADNFCLVHHSHLGTHVEASHTHCDILKINTPAYSIPELIQLDPVIKDVSTGASTFIISRSFAELSYNLPSRAPPAC